MRFETKHIVAISIGSMALVGVILFAIGTPVFLPGVLLSILVMFSEHISDYYDETKRQKQIEEKFPEFVRNLAGTIKSGMPVSQAILQVSDTDYGSLTPYVKKLAYQIEWSIPVHKALLNFSTSTRNAVIQRAISTVIEAEMSGGNLEDVLQTVTSSVLKIKKIKEERKAAIHSQIVQSYIIFVVFLGVMMVIQNLLIPYIVNIESQNIGSLENPGGGVGSSSSNSIKELTEDVKVSFASPKSFLRTIIKYFTSLQGIFLSLGVLQGLFAGLVLGKLSEGDIKSGFRHSLILSGLAFVVLTFGQGFF